MFILDCLFRILPGRWQFVHTHVSGLTLARISGSFRQLCRGQNETGDAHKSLSFLCCSGEFCVCVLGMDGIKAREGNYI